MPYQLFKNIYDANIKDGLRPLSISIKGNFANLWADS
jgi:hypothetical protein